MTDTAGAQECTESFDLMVPSFLTWIERCNDGLPLLASCVRFRIDGKVIGYVDKTFVHEHLSNYPEVFSQCCINGQEELELTPKLQRSTLEERSRVFGEVMKSLRDAGVITGWRDELYPVQTGFHEPPVLLIERAASVFFGIQAYGVHVNGYVKTPSGDIEMWVARRSHNKPTWPGKLDHIVAGGQPYGISPMDNVIKECEEEAGIEAALASKAIPVGAVSYCSKQRQGIKRDVLFCYDLNLPDSFVPRVNDGEVQEFFRLPVRQVLNIVSRTEGDTYKDNCNLVVLDFMVRHGIISPEMPGYLEILRGLRLGDLS